MGHRWLLSIGKRGRASCSSCFGHSSRMSASSDPDVLILVADLLKAIIRESEPVALERHKELKSLAEQKSLALPDLKALIDSSIMDQSLKGLVQSYHILVWVKGVPGQRVAIWYTHSEKLPYPTLRRAWTAGGRLWIRRPWILFRWFLMEIGLLAVPLHLRLAGANHSSAFYFLIAAPEGTQVEACYWHRLVVRSQVDDQGHPTPVEVENIPHESASSALACQHLEREAQAAREVSVDLRLAASGLTIPFLLVAALACACWVGRADTTSFKTLLPLLAVVPGALLGILVERNSEFGRRMGRSLQMQLVALSVLAVVYGSTTVGNLFNHVPHWLSVRFLNGLLTFGSVWLLGILFYLVFLRGDFTHRSINSVYVQYSDVAQYRRDRRVSSLIVCYASVVSATYFSFSDVDAAVYRWVNSALSQDPDWLWRSLDEISGARPMAGVLAARLLWRLVMDARSWRLWRARSFRFALGLAFGYIVLALAILLFKHLLAARSTAGTIFDSIAKILDAERARRGHRICCTRSREPSRCWDFSVLEAFYASTPSLCVCSFYHDGADDIERALAL